MNMLALTIIFPLIGFVLLAFSRGRWSENLSATVGMGSVGLAALVTAYAGIDFFNNGRQAFSVPLWTWMSVGDFNIGFNLVLDGLSLTMLSVVTGVGFLIHMFASWYMRGEEGYSRFFAYTNLFIASMVVLVLADNLLLMYLGWEGVGLCSYLLIGFYYTDPKNGAAAMKAFVVTRVGDVFLAFALFILYNELGTLNFREMVELAPAHFAAGNNMLWWATLMLLHLVGIVGAVTLVLAGFAALVQTDIKRVLAYSTMSQIGYMFLALGVQAWDAAIFHLMTHAFFKALLFLSSGSVILACHHEQNIFKMGGLRKSIPLVYVCFLVGGAALAALPLITAGFFSKDEILAGAMANGHINLMVAGLVGAFMTSLYTFRMIFIVFHGKEQIHAHAGKGITHHLPLIVLLVLSTFVGAMIVPPLQGVLPDTTELEHGRVLTLEITSGVVAIAGILIAAWLWLGKRTLVTAVANSAPGRLLGTWWYNAWGFDWLYDMIFVKPFLGIAWLLKRDPLNSLMNIPAMLSRFAGKGLLYSENGYLRWYVASMSIGAVVVLALLMVLR